MTQISNNQFFDKDHLEGEYVPMPDFTPVQGAPERATADMYQNDAPVAPASEKAVFAEPVYTPPVIHTPPKPAVDLESQRVKAPPMDSERASPVHSSPKLYPPTKLTVEFAPKTVDMDSLTTDDVAHSLNRRTFIATAAISLLGLATVGNFVADYANSNKAQAGGTTVTSGNGQKDSLVIRGTEYTIDKSAELIEDDKGIPTSGAVKKFVSNKFTGLAKTLFADKDFYNQLIKLISEDKTFLDNILIDNSSLSTSVKNLKEFIFSTDTRLTTLETTVEKLKTGGVVITSSDQTILVNGSDIRVNTAKITSGSTTLLDNSVTTSKLVDQSVTTNKIADNSITTNKIVDNSITTAKIVDQSVTTTKIADNSITTIKIVDQSVTTNKLADGSVTSIKLDPALLNTINNKIDDGLNLSTAGVNKAEIYGGVVGTSVSIKRLVGTGAITLTQTPDEITISTPVNSGEANTASNIGVLGVGVFKQKVGTDLQFKNVRAGSSKLIVTDNVAQSQIDVDVIEANLNLGNMTGTVDLATQTSGVLPGGSIGGGIAQSSVTNLISDLSLKADKATTLSGSATVNVTGGGTLGNNNTLAVNEAGLNLANMGGIVAIANGGTGATTTAGARSNLGTNDASNITTGVLATGRGGTGNGATPLNGQIPVGNGTNYTPATITAGSNVTVTNGPGTITIAASGTSVPDGDKGDIIVSSSGTVWNVDPASGFHTNNTAGDWQLSSNNTAVGFGAASLELRETNLAGAGGVAPRLAFHHQGVVASQIALEPTGRIAIRNNPGTGYEDFIARDIGATNNITANSKVEGSSMVSNGSIISAGTITAGGGLTANGSVNANSGLTVSGSFPTTLNTQVNVNSMLAANGQVGTSGQYLASRGLGLSPVWTTPKGGAGGIGGYNLTNQVDIFPWGVLSGAFIPAELNQPGLKLRSSIRMRLNSVGGFGTFLKLFVEPAFTSTSFQFFDDTPALSSSTDIEFNVSGNNSVDFYTYEIELTMIANRTLIGTVSYTKLISGAIPEFRVYQSSATPTGAVVFGLRLRTDMNDNGSNARLSITNGAG